MNFFVMKNRRGLCCGFGGGFVCLFYDIALNWLKTYVFVLKSIHFFLNICLPQWRLTLEGTQFEFSYKKQINWVLYGTGLATSTIPWWKKKWPNATDSKRSKLKLNLILAVWLTPATPPQDNEAPSLKNWFMINTAVVINSVKVPLLHFLIQ